MSDVIFNKFQVRVGDYYTPGSIDLRSNTYVATIMQDCSGHVSEGVLCIIGRPNGFWTINIISKEQTFFGKFVSLQKINTPQTAASSINIAALELNEIEIYK